MKERSIATIGLKELRENTQKYVSLIAAGKSFTVIRRSKPIFRITPVDVWGDEGVWDTVVDFTQVDERGVTAKRVLATLKSLRV
jgi:antitoxin (DNA-binding transcriptional repressor) of toxin-antitoxin stability system